MADQVEKVACNGCTLCCRRELIILTPEDDPALYPDAQVVDVENPYSGAPTTRIIPHRKDGACIYLGMHGCMIYDRRPTMCRVFSCVGFVRRALSEQSASQIRKAIKRGEIDRDVWQAGIDRGAALRTP